MAIRHPGKVDVLAAYQLNREPDMALGPNQRAKLAQNLPILQPVLDYYAEYCSGSHKSDRPNVYVDIIADLLHLARRQRIDVDYVMSMARDHHDAEQSGVDD